MQAFDGVSNHRKIKTVFANLRSTTLRCTGAHDRASHKERANAESVTRESARPSEERSAYSKSCDCLGDQEEGPNRSRA